MSFLLKWQSFFFSPLSASPASMVDRRSFVFNRCAFVLVLSIHNSHNSLIYGHFSVRHFIWASVCFLWDFVTLTLYGILKLRLYIYLPKCQMSSGPRGTLLRIHPPLVSTFSKETITSSHTRLVPVLSFHKEAVPILHLGMVKKFQSTVPKLLQIS